MKRDILKIFVISILTLFSCTPAAVAQSDWFILESSRFKVYYAGGDDQNAEQVSTILQKGFSELAAKLDIDLVQPIHVFLCPSEFIFDELTGKNIPHWGEGVADPINRFIVLKSPNLSHSYHNFPNVVIHELTHILVGESVARPEILPRWFNEGIAIYYSHERDFARGQAISKALLSNSLVPLDEIDEVLNFHQEKARLAYEESYSAILLLKEQFGDQAIVDFIQALGTGKTFSAAFENTFGLDLIDFELQWYKYLEKKYRWRFLLDFDTYLWILILLLCIFVIVAIRFRNRRILKKWDEEERLA